MRCSLKSDSCAGQIDTARPFDHVSEEGTIIHGIIEGDLQAALQILGDLAVPEEMYSCREGRIDIAAPILEDITERAKKRLMYSQYN